MANQDSGLSSSEIMYPAVVGNGQTSGSMVPAQPYAASPVPPFGGGIPRGPEIIHGSFNQTWFINCLRRKWLSALLLGILAAGASFGTLLWLFPLSSSVTAYLRVEALEPESLFDKQQRINPKEFEIFQQTQLTLFKSQFVLKAALSRNDIAQLDVVQKEEPDALLWLSEELKVSFPGEGEILKVSFDGDEDPEQMMKVVDAVIEAYKHEVLYKERTQKSETRDSLERLHKELVAELQEKMDKYQNLSKELDSPDMPNQSTILSMLASEIRLIQQQIIDKKKDLLEIEVNKTLAIQQSKSTYALDMAIQEEMEKDPTFQSFQQEQFAITQQITGLEAITKRKSSPEINRLKAQLQQLAQQIQQYRITKETELRKRFKSAPNDMLQQVITEYLVRRRSIETDLAELEALYDEKMSDVERKGQQSGTLSLLKSEIEQLQEVERTMDFKLRSWDVEDQSNQKRVRIMQPALPQEKINIFERYVIATLGGMAAFCATCYGVALLEFRRRRLNGPSDLDEGLGIRVLGILPSVSARKALAPGSVIAAQLSESIDSVRATLMHDSTSSSRQVVLITSPASMEGCTTVASHLALSLTRAGRRTLLVDGDLREPSLHKLFGMPVEDGLSEVLRSEIDISDALRPTNTEGLWLLSAGQCDMDAIHALATDQLQPIFEKLRAEFDFVIIDGAPILGLSDSISIGQHVDGAILTVLRDHSEIRQINHASELMKEMGIRLIGAVVNGVFQKADRRVARLHGAEAKQQRKLSASTEA